MLLVDDRENDVLIHKLIAAHGDADARGIVKVKRMQSGDYVIGEIGIEAKEINDLYHSIMGHGRSRTIIGQLHDLCETFERPMLVVYNTKLKPWFPGGRGNRAQIAREMKKMAAVIKRFKQTVLLQFPNLQYMELGSMDEFVDWLGGMHHYMRQRRITTAAPPEVSRAPKNMDPRVAALSSIEGVSPRAAHDLLKEFGSLPRILRARTTQRSLMEIEGIGRKRAKAILSLRERYPDQPDRTTKTQ